MTTAKGNIRVTLTMQIKHVETLEKLAEIIGTTKNRLATEVITEFVLKMQEVVSEIEGGKNIESAARSVMRLGLETLSQGLIDIENIVDERAVKPGLKEKEKPLMAGRRGKR